MSPSEVVRQGNQEDSQAATTDDYDMRTSRKREADDPPDYERERLREEGIGLATTEADHLSYPPDCTHDAKYGHRLRQHIYDVRPYSASEGGPVMHASKSSPTGESVNGSYWMLQRSCYILMKFTSFDYRGRSHRSRNRKGDERFQCGRSPPTSGSSTGHIR